MTTCQHPVMDCGNTAPTGTPASCRLCGASVFIPPATEKDRKGRKGISIESHRQKMDYRLNLFHAQMLTIEPMRRREP